MKSRPHAARPATGTRSPSGVAAMLRLLFFGQLRLKRRDGALQVAWGETLMSSSVRAAPKKRARKASRAAGPTPGDVSDSLHLMCSELRIVLASNQSYRRSLRHLVYFEAALSKFGFSALEGLPVALLEQAHAQLAELSPIWVSRDLEMLAVRTEAAILRRGGKVQESVRPRESERLVVTEGTMSTFMMVGGESIPFEEPAPTAT